MAGGVTHGGPVVPPANLDALPTKQLLGVLRRLLRCEESVAASDLSPSDLAKLDPHAIYFKDDPRWSASYENVKRILATREHVPRTPRSAASTSVDRTRRRRT